MTPETLKATREGLKTTQAKLANWLNISKRQYIRYEMGQSAIPGPVAILINGLHGRWPTTKGL